MNFLRLILLVLGFLLIRRLVRNLLRPARPVRKDPAAEAPRAETDVTGRLTDQDISDADFEEIP